MTRPDYRIQGRMINLLHSNSLEIIASEMEKEMMTRERERERERERDRKG